MVDDPVEELAGVLTDPIIVASEGWAETLPDWLKKAITLERMMANMKPETAHEATDSEVVAYLYTASLNAPMTTEFTRIYLFLSMRLMERETKMHQPAFDSMRIEKLSSDEERMLLKLRKQLYDSRIQARKERRKR